MNNQSDDQDKSDNNSISVTNYAEKIYGISFFKRGKSGSDITISPFYPGLEPTKPIIDELERELNQLDSSERLDFLKQRHKIWTTRQDELRRRCQSWPKVLDKWKSKWGKKFRTMSRGELDDTLSNKLENEMKRLTNNHFSDIPNAYIIREVLTHLDTRVSTLKQIAIPTIMKTSKIKSGTKTSKITIEKTQKDFVYVLIRLVELGYIPIDMSGFESFVVDHFKKSGKELNKRSFTEYKNKIRTDPSIQVDGIDKSDVVPILLTKIDRRKHKKLLEYCEENDLSLKQGVETMMDLMTNLIPIYRKEVNEVKIKGKLDKETAKIKNLGKACLDFLKLNIKSE